MALDKSKIKRICKPVDLVGLEGAYIRALNGFERDQLIAWHSEFEKAEKDKLIEAANFFKRRNIALYLCDKDGKRMIGDDELSDVDNLLVIDQNKIVEEGQSYNFRSLEETKKN